MGSLPAISPNVTAPPLLIAAASSPAPRLGAISDSASPVMPSGAAARRVSDRYVSSLLPLALLAPDIVEAIASGRQPPELTAHRLIRTVDLPIAWAAQTQLLGLG
jgi:hypothetical protein